MKPINFIDLCINGGITESENARCLQSRYHKGYSKHRAETSGVMCTISSEVFSMENIEGGYELASCLGTKSGDIFGKHQTDDVVCVPVLTPDRAEKRQNGRRFKENGDDSFTLTSQDRHGLAIEVREAVRGGVQHVA